MAVTEESSRDPMINLIFMIDEAYEFSAPQFYDFVNEESAEDVKKAEMWFETSFSYAPSPGMPRIKAGRSCQMDSCGYDFSREDQTEKVTELLRLTEAKPVSATDTTEGRTMNNSYEHDSPAILKTSTCEDLKNEDVCTKENTRSSIKAAGVKIGSNGRDGRQETQGCTPKQPGSVSKRCPSAKQIASLIKNPSSLKQKKNHLQSSSLPVKGINGGSFRRGTNVKNDAGISSLAQENQSIKRQKLDGGATRQILNFKAQQLFPHKSKPTLTNGSSTFNSSIVYKIRKEERKVYVRENAAQPPFVSMAEMMKKFQSNTRELSLSRSSQDDAPSITQTNLKLTLTRPKEPELETAQRVRSVRVRSSAELEEEMMAKMPKFKAKPLNKKILEAPTLPFLPRSTPQLPEFQEFHFVTKTRFHQNSESASEDSHKIPRLAQPKPPVLQTLLRARARPPKIKSSLELEREELDKIPKFKARPLNKKILESKGELGMQYTVKKHVTEPIGFSFATNQRFLPPPPPPAVAEMFEKLSLSSEPRPHENKILRNTMPRPFNLQTEERGTEKERRFVLEMMQKEMEEERARIPKANPYPYTTDYPVVPLKPEPRPCTKPEPFQLDSLLRHEEEMQREVEDRLRIEKEQAQMRLFRAQPVLKEDPIPLPEKVRRPLTQIQQFNLQLDNRLVHRADFDQKVKEKAMLFKRYREENDALKMLQEEKAVKQLRRTLVPHANPVPNFDHPFCPEKSSKEVTRAVSPNLSVLQRKEMRLGFTAASSMR